MDARGIIVSQKHERDRLLSTDYMERENLESLKTALAHDLIKVIIGPKGLAEKKAEIKLRSTGQTTMVALDAVENTIRELLGKK